MATRTRRAHRSWPQRLLLATNVVLVVACVGAAASLSKLRTTIEDVPVVDIGSALTPAAEVSEPRNFLIIGTDSGEGLDPDDPVMDKREAHGQLADVIMIMRIDPQNQTAKLISIPRDTRVAVAPSGNEGRINAAMQGVDGPINLVQTIKNNFGISIDNYVQVNFLAFRDLVEVLGGVNVYFTTPVRDENSGLAIDTPGCILLDPYQALAYARSRHFYYYDAETKKWTLDGSGDLGRISRQQDFIKRALRRAADKGLRNPNTALSAINAASDSVKMDTTLDVGTLLSLAKQFQNFNPDSLESTQIKTVSDIRGDAYQGQKVVWEETEPMLEAFRGIDPATGVVASNVIVSVAGPEEDADRLNQTVQQLDTAGFDADIVDARKTPETTTVSYGFKGRDAAILLARQLGTMPEFKYDPTIVGYRVILTVGDDFGGVLDAAKPVDQLPADQLPPGIDAAPSTTASPSTSTSPSTSESTVDDQPVDEQVVDAPADVANTPGVVPTDEEAAALCR